MAKNRQQYASLLAKLEGGKSEARIGDIRQILKLQKDLELQMVLMGYKSLLLGIRREAVAEAKKLIAKKGKRK